MTTYHFESIAVYAELGGALRLARSARAFVTDPTTGAPVDATQGAVVAPYVDADAAGDVSFTAESWPVRLTNGATYEDVWPVDAGMVAVTDLADPASAARVELDATYLSAFSLFVPNAVGQWYANPIARKFGARERGLDTVSAHAFYSGAQGVTLSQFDHNISTAGASGAKVRLGLWRIDNQSRPFMWTAGVQWATLLADLGTVAADTTGRKTLTPGTAIAIPAQTWFAVGGVEQVAVSTALVADGWALGSGPYGSSNGQSYSSHQSVSLTMSGVTGALGNFTSSAAMFMDDGVGIYRSA